MKIEIRANQLLIEGYVNTTYCESRKIPSPQGPFIETILPKTFEKALSRVVDLPLLFNHKKDRKLASIKQGNLELYEDNVGLKIKTAISDHEVRTLAAQGKLKGWSFGMYCRNDYWKDGPDGIPRRKIFDLDLTEVSLLDTQPAYTATSINIIGEKRHIMEQRNVGFITSEEAIKQFLREKELEIIQMRGGIK